MTDDHQVFMMRYYDDKSNHKTGSFYKKLDDEYVVSALGFNKFSEEKMKIPSDATFEELSNNQIGYFCRDAVPDPNLDGIELNNWEEHIRDKCLTINDIKTLKKGDKITVLIMDRNLGDTVCGYNETDKLYDPKIFFREKIAIYIHDHDLSGFIIWDFDLIDEDLNDLSNFTSDEVFEFDIEYKLHHWYPLKNNNLPEFDSQGLVNFGSNSGKHYDEFPRETLIGWRGPMMLWDKLDDIDTHVYWHDSVSRQ
jgi:hypothetical protein